MLIMYTGNRSTKLYKSLEEAFYDRDAPTIFGSFSLDELHNSSWTLRKSVRLARYKIARHGYKTKMTEKTN